MLKQQGMDPKQMQQMENMFKNMSEMGAQQKAAQASKEQQEFAAATGTFRGRPAIILLSKSHGVGTAVPQTRLCMANRSDQSHNKGMRTRCILDGLDLINVQNPQVGLSSVVKE
ncbi:MAG: hypothetical protein WBN81_05110 [Gammaproteobacteria bacterium]